MLMMEIECGTKVPEKFEIDLDRYDNRYGSVSPEDHKRAYDLLRKTMNDWSFAEDGNRNTCAVNGCIALFVLGYDPETWFENFCDEQEDKTHRWFASDLWKFMEHVKRVNPYVYKWGPAGNEARALDFAI